MDAEMQVPANADRRDPAIRSLWPRLIRTRTTATVPQRLSAVQREPHSFLHEHDLAAAISSNGGIAPIAALMLGYDRCTHLRWALRTWPRPLEPCLERALARALAPLPEGASADTPSDVALGNLGSILLYRETCEPDDRRAMAIAALALEVSLLRS